MKCPKGRPNKLLSSPSISVLYVLSVYKCWHTYMHTAASGLSGLELPPWGGKGNIRRYVSSQQLMGEIKEYLYESSGSIFRTDKRIP